jgi:hypothetical protein
MIEDISVSLIEQMPISERVFSEELSATLGKRLGVPFLRAQKEEIEVYFNQYFIFYTAPEKC